MYLKTKKALLKMASQVAPSSQKTLLVELANSQVPSGLTVADLLQQRFPGKSELNRVAMLVHSAGAAEFTKRGEFIFEDNSKLYRRS